MQSSNKTIVIKINKYVILVFDLCSPHARVTFVTGRQNFFTGNFIMNSLLKQFDVTATLSVCFTVHNSFGSNFYLRLTQVLYKMHHKLNSMTVSRYLSQI